MASRPRPLSPHLQIYKPQISSALSIFHRATGVFLSLGAAALVVWLVALAAGEEYFQPVHAFMVSLPGRLLLLAFLASHYYHLFNGVRHLFWDAGMGYELKNVDRGGIAVLLLTVICAALTWAYAFQGDLFHVG